MTHPHSARGTPEAGVRKRIRKGTHSCIECRRRKTKCVFRPDNPSVCVECFGRGAPCIDQTHAELGDALSDNRPNLRERVARLESLLEGVLSGQTTASSRVNENERGAAEALSNLRSEISFSSTPVSSPDSSATDKYYPRDAPLISIFDNAVLKRKEIGSESSKTGKHEADYSSSGEQKHGARAEKDRGVRAQLLSILPDSSSLQRLIDLTGVWYNTFFRMFLELDADSSQQNLQQYLAWALGHDDPCIVAKGVLCVAVSVQLSKPGKEEESLNLPLPAEKLMLHYLNVVERAIVADDDYMTTLAGIQVTALLAKCYVDIAQPRKTWLLAHRGISYAQMLGYHKEHHNSTRKESHRESRMRRSVWYTLYEIDRYMSVFLGLPYAIVDSHQAASLENDDIPNCSPQATLCRRQLCTITGRVVDRNQSSTGPSLALTLQIDQDLEQLRETVGSSWWETAEERNSGKIGDEEAYERMMLQFAFHQTRAFVHLPFMLRSGTDRRFDYCRLACFDASRELVKLYRAMRQGAGAAFHLCKVLDFQVFTGAMLLILGLFGYGKTSTGRDLAQEEQDWQLIEMTMENLRVTSQERGGGVAAQSLRVLETLSSVRYERCPYDNGDHPSQQPMSQEPARKFVVPYFGTIYISPGKQFSAPEPPTPQKALSHINLSTSLPPTPDSMSSSACCGGAAGGSSSSGVTTGTPSSLSSPSTASVPKHNHASQLPFTPHQHAQHHHQHHQQSSHLTHDMPPPPSPLQHTVLVSGPEPTANFTGPFGPGATQILSPSSGDSGDQSTIPMSSNPTTAATTLQQPSFDNNNSPTYNFNFELPHIDIDWQSMVDMDLVQDWNWPINLNQI
ncbi:hypothetical protein L228DRAFT_246538 [Xylona heveae TC161]|uniref:Zn(2)-C6 fungal-type domain-containing protein n=1 Tax=Xylona heveae (strain CBS 132557 / TC161) TaxID=1328760 RepID=A0A165HLK1_XYLHT|nr:hypothetical protein L228DRAFT_246538 [Xylona heveae TC161]KZF23699.1 hypothetical protein L228DRAFT_246538 [Xylona heveae TC161]